jgi:hypothetical protein
MQTPDVRDKFVYPTAAVVIGSLIVAGILTAAKSTLFWAVAGGIALAVVGALVVRSFVRLGRGIRELQDGLVEATEQLRTLATGIANEGRALNELSGEVNRLGGRIARVERYTLPDWLRVAIAFNLGRGGHVDPEANGIRFSQPDGVEIYTLRPPMSATDEAVVMQTLHDRLGLDNNTYLEALLGIDQAYAAGQGTHADRLRDLEAQLDDIRDLVKRKGFGEFLDQPPG